MPVYRRNGALPTTPAQPPLRGRVRNLFNAVRTVVSQEAANRNLISPSTPSHPSHSAALIPTGGGGGIGGASLSETVRYTSEGIVRAAQQMTNAVKILSELPLLNIGPKTLALFAFSFVFGGGLLIFLHYHLRRKLLFSKHKLLLERSAILATQSSTTNSLTPTTTRAPTNQLPSSSLSTSSSYTPSTTSSPSLPQQLADDTYGGWQERSSLTRGIQLHHSHQQ